MKALINSNFSITKKDEIVTIITLDIEDQTAIIQYSNGYTETMMLNSLTIL